MVECVISGRLECCLFEFVSSDFRHSLAFPVLRSLTFIELTSLNGILFFGKSCCLRLVNNVHFCFFLVT